MSVLSKIFRRRPEVRESYTDMAVARIMANAGGASDGAALAAVETAARLWGAGLSSATVTPSSATLEGVTPPVLDAIGRSLCRSGESLWAIDVRGGQVRLIACGSWNVSGSDDPSTWRYHCTLTGPTSTRTVTLDAASVVHIRYAPCPSRPWAGRSPVRLAVDTARAAGLLEKATSEELNFTQKQLIAPRRGAGDFSPIDSLSPDVITKIVESFAQHVGAPTIVLPADVVPSRLGPEPPQSFSDLRNLFENSMLAMHGIPPALVAARGTGAGARESFRQVLHSLIKPLGELVVQEIREKLDPAAHIDFAALRAGDITGSARAFGSLVTAGLTPQSAAAIVGFDDVEVSA